MAYDIGAAIEEAAKYGDETVPQTGGDFKPLEEGKNARLRLVRYIELGIHKDEYKGKPKTKEKVNIAFEVSGPKWPANEDGSRPLLEMTMTKSLFEKANFYRLFNRLRDGDESIRIFAQLVGREFVGDIRHNVNNGKTYANLTDADGNITVRPPFIDKYDEESGDTNRIRVKVPEAATPLKVFLWNYPQKEMWDDIFIDGVWEAKEGQPEKSKNRFQNLIMSAENFEGSPIQRLLKAGGQEPDLPQAEQPKKSKAKPPVQEEDDEVPF